MKNISCFGLLVMILLSQLFVQAQPVQYRFQHLTTEHGLPQNTVYDVCQDKYGFMWFSTKNGICRYDGYSTKVFRPTDHFHDDVADLSQCIETTRDGNLVFGTSMGIYIFDIEKDSITRRIIYGTDTTDKNINNIYSLCVEGNIVWAGSGNGLLRYDLSNGMLRYFSGREIYPAYIAGRFWIKGLATGPDGNIWLCTPDGLIKWNTKTFHADVFNPLAQGQLKVDNKYFSSAVFDKKGRLWAGTLRKGVYCFDFKNQIYQNINFTGLTDSSETFNEVKRITCDSNGMIWAATQYTGLVHIDPATMEYQHIRSNISSPYSLASDLVSALYEDRAGILWAGTYNSGVDRTSINGSQFINIPYSSTDSSCFGIKAVECFVEQDINKVWIGTMKGLFLFDKSNHRCITFEEYTQNKIKLPHYSIAGLEFDEKGNLWIGSRSDIVLRVNLEDFSYTEFRPDTSNPLIRGSADFKMMVKHSSGDLYLSFDTRILKYDKGSDSLMVVVDKDSTLLRLTRANHLAIDEKYLFLSSDYNGLFYLDIEENKVGQVILPEKYRDRLSLSVRIRKFPNGNYLLSDYKGFYILDGGFNLKYFYNDKNGLSDNKIVNTHIDEGGRAWLATFNGLTVYNPTVNSFLNYYIQDGLMENEFREAKSMQGKDGTLYFPTNKGFTYFQPAGIRSRRNKADVFFTTFRIFNKEEAFSKNINNLREIRIPAGSSFFSISFASTGFSTLQPSAYAYKLEGVNQEWVTTTSNTANYTNIEGGEYVFRIKSLSDDSAERTVKIIVGTFFYKTTWFRFLVLLLLAIVIFWFVRFRENLVMKRESSKIIDYFANSHYGKNTVEEIIWDVCRNCISRLGFEDAVVYLVDQERNVLVQKAAYGPKNPKEYEIVHPLDIPVGQGIVGTVALTGKPELIYDTTRDPRYISDDEQRMSELAVPIIHEGKVIGVIDSEHSLKRFFNKEHLRILTTIASICSTKIAKAQSDLAATDRERKLLEIGKKVAETRLMALRAQMNPHFIFNSLNSIQECIVKEKVEDAHKYLSRFSMLLRMVIDYSERSFISLEDEIKFLKLYLGLESLRFGESFSYDIFISPEVDEEETIVPSLLIQPFVENAIWHGLLHKNGKRELKISFINKNNEQLVCIVEDNGIGRVKSAKIKSSKLDAQSHESKGMRISQERIDLLRLQTHLNPEIVIEDLYDEYNNAAGTRVSVALPLELEVSELK